MRKENIIIKNSDNNKERIEFNTFTIIPGTSNVLISAPHAKNHFRKGKIKYKDQKTLTLAKMISELTSAHVIFTNKDINYDPNYDIRSVYKKHLKQYVIDNNIKYVIDLHGTRILKMFDIEIGTNNLKNIDHDQELLDEIVKILKKNKMTKIRIDKKFKSSSNTVSHYISRNTDAKALQFEISRRYRSLTNNLKQFRTLLNSLLEVIYYLERRNTMEDINYIEKYDKVLDIKPSYGYTRELGEIKYNQVGLEIEVAVNYERSSYTFIKKMLTNIKDLIGENGYFVKDGTIKGAYSFEIVLDPLNIIEINRIYKSLEEIIEFSNGLIEISKEKNCGIHLNFNKLDITDIKESHKRCTAFVLENKEMFEQNIYKQYKFIWDYEEFETYQKEVGSKYLWINYIKRKLVEIRNIKTPITANELTKVIDGLLQSLYYDKEQLTYDHQAYKKLNKLYDQALDKAHHSKIIEKLNTDEFIVISLKDATASVVELSDELKSKLKEEIK